MFAEFNNVLECCDLKSEFASELYKIVDENDTKTTTKSIINNILALIFIFVLQNFSNGDD